jgi:hypothetical protein
MALDKPEENRKDIDQLDAVGLTDWAKEPTVADLKQDYVDASTDRDNHIANVDKWLDNLNITGSAKRKYNPGKSSITPKLIRKQAEWRYASLSEPFLDTDEIYEISPVTYEDKAAAEQNAIVLNNQFNTKIQKQKFIDDYIRTAVDEGTVIVRVGWEEKEIEVEVPNFEYHITDDPKVMQQHQIIAAKLQEDNNFLATLNPEVQEAFELSQSKGVPYEVVPVAPTMEMQTVANRPTLEVLNYNNVTIDPTAMGDTSKANFFIVSFESSIAELKADGKKYHNLDKINIENNTILGEPDHDTDEESNFNFHDKSRKKFVVYEYWGKRDINDDGVLVPIVAAYVGDTLIRMERNPFPDQELPFVVAQYLPVRRSMYGQPDGELLEENQKIIGAVTRGMVDSMARSANGQMGRRKDALDVTNRRRFDRGEDYDFNGAVDPRQAFFMHTYPEIPQSAQLMLSLQNAEAESLTGVRAFAQSNTGNIGSNTAAGVRSATDAASKRELGILRRLAKGIEQIGRKIISMNAEFLDEEEIVRVSNSEFVPVRRDDLQGNFDLRLTISTAEANESKAEQLAFMLQTTGQTVGPEMSQIILADIAKLRKMPALAKKIEEYQPQPDPIAQEKAALEIELLRAQIANESAKANENNANANLDNAKAKNLDTQSDKNNLDFLEQESGVKQERDKELVGEQARGNMVLENQKHINKLRENQLSQNKA